MTHLTTLDELKQHITILASVDESGAPFFSAYLNLEDGQTGWRETLDERARILRRVLKGDALADFEEALLRLAGRLERPVEVVEQSDALMSLGGVGCLLRYRPNARKEEPVYLAQV